MFLPTFSTNLFCCQGFKHTKDKRIQKISSLHLLEITAVLREAMTSLNETLLLFFLLKRQIWHINTELQTHQRRTATRWRNCSLNGTSGGKSHLKSYKTKLTWQRLHRTQDCKTFSTLRLARVAQPGSPGEGTACTAMYFKATSLAQSSALPEMCGLQ